MVKILEYYKISIQGHLGKYRAKMFGGMSIKTLSSGITVLHGSLVDQAALHGILSRLRDMGIPLLEVKRFNKPIDRIDA